MTGEVTLSECTRPTTCYDCTEESCWHHGDKGADCPKVDCREMDCEHCGFIDSFIQDMRQVYAGTGNTVE